MKHSCLFLKSRSDSVGVWTVGSSLPGWHQLAVYVRELGARHCGVVGDCLLGC